MKINRQDKKRLTDTFKNQLRACGTLQEVVMVLANMTEQLARAAKMDQSGPEGYAKL